MLSTYSFTKAQGETMNMKGILDCNDVDINTPTAKQIERLKNMVKAIAHSGLLASLS